MRTIFVAAVLAAAAAAVPAADVLLMGDPEAGAIYERGLGEGAGPARLVSGKIGFLADAITIGSDDFAFYSISGRVVEFDQAAGTLAAIHELGAGDSLTRMAAGGENRLGLAIIDSDDVRIVVGTRTAPGQPWVFAETGISRPKPVSNVFDLLPVGSGKWVIVADTSSSLASVVLVDEADPGTPVVVGSYGRTARVDGGPGGNWVLFSTTGAFATEIRDSAGALLKTIPAASGTVFDERPRALHWNAGAGGTDAVTFTGISRADDPLDTNPVGTLLHSFLGALGHDPNLDVSDASEIRRTGTGGWQVARESVGILADVDGSTGATATSIAVSKGSGPAIANIVDMVAGDGKLWALCGYSSPQAIVEVDRATGNRTLHAIIDSPAPCETIAREDDGTILLSSREQRGDTPGPAGRWHVVRRIASIDGSSVATLQVVAEGPGDGAQFSMTLDSQQRPVIATICSDGPSAWRGDGGAMQGLGFLEVAGTTPILVVSPGVPRFSAQVAWPATGAPLQGEQVLVHLAGTTGGSFFGSSGISAARVILPDATVLNIPDSDLIIRNDTSSVPYAVTITLALAMTGSVPQSGTWTIELDRTGSAPATTWSSSGLTTKAVGAVAASTLLDDDSVLAIRAGAAELATISLANGEVADVAISSGDAALAPSDLNRVREIIVDPASGDVFAALRDSARVMRINPATGIAIEFISGRPVGIDEELLGLEGDTWYSLAIAPEVEQVSAVESFELY